MNLCLLNMIYIFLFIKIVFFFVSSSFEVSIPTSHKVILIKKFPDKKLQAGQDINKRNDKKYRG